MMFILLLILPTLPWTACFTTTTPEDDTESVPTETIMTAIEMTKDIVTTVIKKDDKFSAGPGWEKCPYPPEDTIDPCKCYGKDLSSIVTAYSMARLMIISFQLMNTSEYIFIVTWRFL